MIEAEEDENKFGRVELKDTWKSNFEEGWKGFEAKKELWTKS